MIAGLLSTQCRTCLLFDHNNDEAGLVTVVRPWVSEQTFYRWKKKFAGMHVAELRRLKRLQEESSSDAPFSDLCGRLIAGTEYMRLLLCVSSVRSVEEPASYVEEVKCQPSGLYHPCLTDRSSNDLKNRPSSICLNWGYGNDPCVLCIRQTPFAQVIVG